MTTQTEDGCWDGQSPEGGLWLDQFGRSCIYYDYEKTKMNNNNICNISNTNTTTIYNPMENCCICNGQQSLTKNEAIIIVDYQPVWAIVVVLTCLLFICLLSCSFYFLCHLYRNEKRTNYRLQKVIKSHKNGVITHTATSKSEISKTDLEQDEYEAIPGDIGVGNNKRQKTKLNNIKNGDGGTSYNDYDDDGGHHTHSPTGSHIFKVRPSFRKNPPSNVSSNTLTNDIKPKNNHHADKSISITIPNGNSTNSNNNKNSQFTEPKSNQNSPLIASDEEEIADLDEYAAIDSSAINKPYKRNEDIKRIKDMKYTREKPQFVKIKFDKYSNNDNNNNNNNNNKNGDDHKETEKNQYLDYKSTKSYHQSPRRRYSAELEFNPNSHHAKQRKRQSSKFNKRFENLTQTQDDMIFLSLPEYLENNDDTLHENDDDDDDNGTDDGDGDGDGDDDGVDTEDDDIDDLDDNKQNNHNNHNNNTPKTISPDLISIPYKKRSSRRITTKEDFTRISTKRVIKLFAPQEIKYSDIDFTKQEFIGKGSFGKVVRAKYHEIDVAVKTLHTQRLTGSELINFKREAAIMQKVGGHKHIARMYGFCTKPQICIVTEYYARGSLHDIIKAQKKQKKERKESDNNHNNNKIEGVDRMSTDLKIQMSIEASLGIWHLHQHEVIHRDISARNLLVDKNWTVVVADLGMSRLKKRGNIKIKSNIGPVKWMAPESIIGHEYSEKSDSYSFGITLYEIFSESEPYPGLLPLEAGAKVVHEGLRPSINKNKKIKNVPNLIKLLSMLWKPQPKDRPDFLFIQQSLRKIKKQWKTLTDRRNIKRN